MREKRSARASSTKSALTAWVPCQTLVAISGSAVIRTTKIGVIGDSPNHMIAKMAQIADETVFMTGRMGSKNSPTERLEPSRMPSGTPIATAIAKPIATRPSVVNRLAIRSPLCRSSMMRSNTRSGRGKM